MLILTKAVLAMMIGLLTSAGFGLFIIPILKKMNLGQRVSIYVEDFHSKKNGTPTMGGLIFILPTLITTLIFILMGKIDMSINLLIVLLVFVGYALIGFLDDYLSLKNKRNLGFTEIQKLFFQIIVALIFFFLFMKSGSEPILWIYSLGIKINMGWLYGVFILFVLVGTSNAVNLTDGLDGLAGGLSAIAFIAMGIITLGTGWLEGFQDIGMFSFILTGSLFGFLIFNSHPAKVFMGDTGSLSLGATLAAIAILTRHELTLIIVGGVFVIETLTAIIQIVSVKLFNKKVFLMTPIHHTFEKLGWAETDIVKLFWVIGLTLAMAALAFGVWI